MQLRAQNNFVRYRPWLSILSLILIFYTSLHVANCIASTPENTLEQQAQILFTRIRCLSCAGQSIAGSQSSFAIMLRQQIRHMLAEGQSQNDILITLEKKYGETMSYLPPRNTSTLILWGTPLALLFGAIAIMLRRSRLSSTMS